MGGRLKSSSDGQAPEKGRGTNVWLRAVAAKCLVRYGGQSQRAAAELLGLGTGAAVSAQLKSLESRLTKDRSLRRLVAGLEKKLAAERGHGIDADEPNLV